ncbi:MAG: class IIb bacteriocin, lactobin A/cerein 7B family [Cytophagales bacterium]|nr:MAG: class IIb bacteriocin, lactobin A/cerein 7B family [Cytophagales bacterium]
MKNLTLDSYGVQEMNEGEMVNVEGGIAPLIIIGLICLAALVSCSGGQKKEEVPPAP